MSPQRDAESLRLAIVGCGAISQAGHGPGALLSRSMRLTTLVDLDVGRARELGAKLGVSDCRNTLEGLEKDVDVAIAAVPHRAHLPVGTELMKRGIHVLMEKPLGCTVAECRALADTAASNGVVLAVALVRRFIAVNRLVKQIIDFGLLGRPVSFEMFDTREFSWPLKTTFLLDPSEPGRGVLIGNGSHMFDLILWWFGRVADVSCMADSRNGAETDATVDLRHESGVTGRLHVSRIRDLGANAQIKFEKGRITVPPFGPDIQVETNDGPFFTAKPTRVGATAKEPGLRELMALQLDDFAAAVRGEKAPVAGTDIATETIALVERCAAVIRLTDEPWWSHPVFPSGSGALGIPVLTQIGDAA